MSGEATLLHSRKVNVDPSSATPSSVVKLNVPCRAFTTRALRVIPTERFLEGEEDVESAYTWMGDVLASNDYLACSFLGRVTLELTASIESPPQQRKALTP